MKILSLITSLFLLASLPMQAQDNGAVSETFQVWGNCGMCKRVIEKAATSVDGVKYAVWDMETDMITVKFKSGKTNVEAIKKAIAASGYDTEEFRATDEVYNALHGCCQYDRPAKRQ